ncbi:hypothetical protein DVA67_027840 [Solirubrobacter sp. CPCC 204708]|uniref:Uncharacterized protein n=1 Tax=Solirubrobacter deserti TaxID=2282478 RepID=A0ABT4RJN4_9ACTN|nr:hypothetical protein [Solirubrobacter deserti]MBE2319808.1 hypothetical protein [Solirubrobacter deserti]MDA0138710.1 hypothetical protein [Solirubrobacter deserti]
MPNLSAPLAALAAGAVAASFGVIAPDVMADADAPTGASILAPTADEFAGTGEVPVRLRTGSKITAVRVFNGTHDVTRRFSRRGDQWTAKLPRSVVDPGKNKLVVQAMAGDRSGEATTVTFVAGRAKPSPLTVRSGTDRSGQLPVAVATPMASRAELTVNGRRVRAMHDSVADTDHRWLVSRQDGLRAGRNALVVRTYDQDGRHAVKRWTVERPANLPFVEAGAQSRAATAGRWLTLDGSRSEGRQLDYTWTVVKAPKGAKPELRRANSAKASFKPDKSGVYEIALRATRGGKARAASAAGAVQDVTTVYAAPTFGSQGLYVGTDLEHGNDPDDYASIRYGGEWYAAANATNPDLFLQIDPATLAVLQTGDHTQITPTAGKITIGVWNDASVPYTDDRYGSMVWIGTQVVANSSAGSQGGAGNPYSNLHGWLTPTSTKSPVRTSPQWVSSDFLQVQTRAETSALPQNTMTVNGQPKTVTLPSGVSAGYQLVVLDNAGNMVFTPDAYPITGNATADTATENQLAADIENWNQGTTILIQGFGPLPSVPANSDFANELDALGGRSDVAFLLNATHDANGGAYALIAGQRTTGNLRGWYGKEASHDRTGGGTLTALLARDPEADNYVARQSDSATGNSAGAQRYKYLPFVYGAPTPWAGAIRNANNTAVVPATAGQSAALAWIADYASTNDWTVTSATAQCPGAPDPIRASYCTTSATDLQNLKDNITNHLPAYSTTTSFSSDDYAAAQNNFEWEIADVASVQADLSAYANLYSIQNSIQAIVDANSIGQQIQKTQNLELQAQNSSTSDGMNIAVATLQMTSALPDVGSIASFFEGMIEMAQAVGTPDEPTPSLANQIELTEANAGSTVAANLSAAADNLDQFALYLVQDPQKLFTGAYALSRGDLALTTDTKSDLVTATTYGVRQYLWGAILGTSYAAFTGSAAIGTNPECNYNDGTPVFPFKNVLTGNSHWSWKAPDSSGVQVNWWIAMTQTSNPLQYAYQHNNIGLDASVTNPLFAPIDPSLPVDQQVNVGAVMPYFALDYLPFIPVREVNPDRDPSPGTGCVVTKY